MKTSTMESSTKRKLYSALAILFWLLVWQGLAMWIHEPILLVSPIEAGKRLIELLPSTEFWRSILFSFSRIFLGFVLSGCLGIVLAVISYRFSFVKTLLRPLISCIKAIPVASFVILVLLWVSSKNLSIIISILIALPVIYTNTLNGLESVNPKLLEMAKVFRIPFLKRIRFIFLHEVRPFLHSGLIVAVGLCWKSGIAAEVIGIPSGSIGEKLYTAKVYLETPDLFCWTAVIIMLSVLCEKLVRLVLKGVK